MSRFWTAADSVGVGAVQAHRNLAAGLFPGAPQCWRGTAVVLASPSGSNTSADQGLLTDELLQVLAVLAWPGSHGPLDASCKTQNPAPRERDAGNLADSFCAAG